MAYVKKGQKMTQKGQKMTQKTFRPKPKNDSGSSGIEETQSWINAKGKAVYVNIAETDLVVKDGRVSFITSLSSLERLISGEIGGVKLGRFVDDGE